MNLSTYVTFAGTCEEAFQFYTQHLGGKIDMLSRFAEAPAAMRKSDEWDNKIMHGSMTIGGTVLMGMDASPNMYQTPQGFYVALMVRTPEEAEKAWAALSEGGTVRMPLTESFFAKRFGMLADKFAIPWMINCPP